ncbi:hypothetical protein QM543_09990 [Pantoea eucrina]|uniref:hypothetical protein n=1 Tax=Pantoea eucrina TaxID=472693 RepID=UPI0024B7F447|nr:hypothetical protein [Pantoea eucrina]MDJ0023614.1 hypothetical protein [Pantoea eucrina]
MTHASMTSTAAIQHMSHTLTGAIAQSHQPGFIAAEAYADIKTNYELVASSCNDLATVVWLREHLCFGYMGDECTFEEINLPHRDHLDFILMTGWRPGEAPAHKMVLSNMFEMDWWEPKQITITGHTPDEVTGTATITETEGEYQIAFEWQMQMGEAAESVNLPALVNITAARFTLPYEFSLYECDETPLDTLEAVQEMDCALGFCAEIFNEVYPKFAPAEGATDRG